MASGLQGFDCEIVSDIPIGSGVSSSAALECGLAYGLNKLFDLHLDRMDIVKLSQRAEHNFVGTKCGIMDQFASVMSKENNLIQSPFKEYLSKTLPMIENLSQYWDKADGKTKKKILGCIFKEKLEDFNFERCNHIFTPEIESIILVSKVL